MNIKTAGGVLFGALLSITTLSGDVKADNEPGPNTVAYWCGDANDAGIKYEPVDTPFIVPAPPDGYVWTLLIVKAGSTDIGNGPGNDAPIANPVVGDEYSHSSGKDISHIILCMDPEPKETTTTVTETTTTVAETTTTVAETTTTAPTETTTTVAEVTTTTALTATAQPPVPPAMQATTTTSGPNLPRTGSNLPIGLLITTALICLALGSAVVIGTRRK